MLGDTAVAVIPRTSAMQHLVGKMVRLPLDGRKFRSLPTQSSSIATWETGVVKVTRPTIRTTNACGQRHKLR